MALFGGSPLVVDLIACGLAGVFFLILSACWYERDSGVDPDAWMLFVVGVIGIVMITLPSFAFMEGW